MSNKTKAKKEPKHIVKGFVSHIKQYWNKAPQGRYLSYKEAAAYCVGGMGAVGATVVPVYVTLSAGLYIAAALKFKVDDIVLIGIITSIITILRSPLLSIIIDNTNTKYGKFRPYLIWMPIPITICFIGFGLLGYIESYYATLVLYTIIFNVMQFFMALYSLAFTTLIQVITPNQSEKEWMMGIGSFVYSLGPSIVHAGLPLIANLIFTVSHLGEDGKKIVDAMGINTIGPYQWLVPLMLAICFALGYVAAFGTKERIVKPKEQKQHVSFAKGVRDTSCNKYFWITNTSAIISVFKLIGSTFTAWLCSYAIKQSWAQSLFVTLISTAYTPGMLLAPLLIKKFGKKKLTIYSNFAIAIMTIPMVLACIKPMNFTPYILLIINYLIILVNSIQVVTTPAMQTQVYDYQQYKTGERLEGFISQYGAIIVTLFGMATAFIQPAIFKNFGFDQDPDVLNDPNILYPIIGASCLLGIASGVLGTIPYFFWDLSERRHQEIIEILKVRAIHGDQKISDEVAEKLETEIEAGAVDALSAYIVEHHIEGLEDYISIKIDSLDTHRDTELSVSSSDSKETALRRRTMRLVEHKPTASKSWMRHASAIAKKDRYRR